MRELWGILQTCPRPGTPWRPVEQAPFERDHQEFQKLEGCFVFDVFESFPGEWDEMLPFLELCRMNLPCPVTGVTPRDLDRVVGRRASRDISADETLTWDLVGGD